MKYTAASKLPSKITPVIGGKKYPPETVISVTAEQKRLVEKALGHKGRKGKHGIEHYPYDDTGGYRGSAMSSSSNSSNSAQSSSGTGTSGRSDRAPSSGTSSSPNNSSSGSGGNSYSSSSTLGKSGASPSGNDPTMSRSGGSYRIPGGGISTPTASGSPYNNPVSINVRAGDGSARNAMIQRQAVSAMNRDSANNRGIIDQLRQYRSSADFPVANEQARLDALARARQTFSTPEEAAELSRIQRELNQRAALRNPSGTAGPWGGTLAGPWSEIAAARAARNATIASNHPARMAALDARRGTNPMNPRPQGMDWGNLVSDRYNPREAIQPRPQGMDRGNIIQPRPQVDRGIIIGGGGVPPQAGGGVPPQAGGAPPVRPAGILDRLGPRANDDRSGGGGYGIPWWLARQRQGMYR